MNPSHLTLCLLPGKATALWYLQPHTSNRSSKIPSTTLRLQMKLERSRRQKRRHIDLKTKQINWWTGKKNSHLSAENKLLVYQAAINPIWIYGTELWGCASKSNTVIMQRSQSKTLRAIANSPRYVTIHTLHTDLNIPYVSAVIHERINKQHNKLEAHPNPILQPPLN